MSKPAAKEPSMDEILSSIRQIIADDDAGVAPRRPSTANAAAAPRPQPMSAPPQQPAEAPPRMAAPRPAPQPEPAPRPAPAAAMSWEDMLPAAAPEPEPLALSADQMLPPDDEPLSALNFSTFMADAADEETAPQAAMPELVDPDDIAFEMPEAMAVEAPEAEFEDLQPPRHSWMDPMAAEPEPEPEPVAAAADEWSFDPDPEPEPEPVMAIEPEMSFDIEPEPVPTPSPTFIPRASVAEAAPMPDPTLSADMAEQLLEPATGAAVRHTFAKLNQLHVGTPGITVEAMLREMLRPMLKDWLDENLPAMVERMVEREISRIARGE